MARCSLPAHFYFPGYLFLALGFALGYVSYGTHHCSPCALINKADRPHRDRIRFHVHVRVRTLSRGGTCISQEGLVNFIHRHIGEHRPLWYTVHVWSSHRSDRIDHHHAPTPRLSVAAATMFSSSKNSLPRRTDSLTVAASSAPKFTEIEEELHDIRRVHTHGQEEDLRMALSRMISRVEELVRRLYLSDS